MNSIRRRLRAITERRNVGLDLFVIVTRADRTLVGRHTHDAVRRRWALT